MAKKTIYLDYAAATPMDTAVLLEMMPYFTDRYYNPSAQYLNAKKTREEIEKARFKVSQIIGSRSSEVIFTSGGTESNNLAIKGIMEKFPDGNIIVSAIEHESVILPAKNYLNKVVPVGSDGIVDLNKLNKLIDNKTVLVSIIHASNEIGSIQPLRAISQIIKAVRKSRLAENNKLPIYLHSDACQSPSYLDIHVSNLGLDLMTLNGGKIYGPKQSGILYIHHDVSLLAQILGGGQEMGNRSGTENVPSIIGFAKALSLAQENRLELSSRTTKLQKLFISEISRHVKNYVINGSLNKRIPSNLNFTFTGHDNETLLMQLDELGIECASGSACNAKNNSASHVLLAIGLSEELARSSLRFSFGNATTENDIKRTSHALIRLLN